MDKKDFFGVALGLAMSAGGDMARLAPVDSLPHKIAEAGDCYDAYFGMYNPLVNTCGRERTPLHEFADEVSANVRQALED